jgi:hypothetical protein
MLIVVKFFTAYQNAEGQYVCARVSRTEVAVTPQVADAVDHAPSPGWNPHHLDGPVRYTDDTQQSNVDHHEQADSQVRVHCIDVPFHPVVRRSAIEPAQRFFVP